MRFGFHLSTAGGPSRAAAEARRLGLDCLQIFAGSPRGWKHKPPDEAQAREFRREAAQAGLDPVVVHAPYLVNLASPDRNLRRRSVRLLTSQLRAARSLGAAAVVVHPGSRGESSLARGVERTARGVRRALEEAEGPVECWLENTAGGGRQLGGPLAQLAMLLEALEGRAVGACLDTAHAWGAGYRLDGVAPAARFLDRVQALLGLEAVKLWHLNDAAVPRGSRRDRHCRLGRGRLGVEGLRGILQEPRMQDAALVMETPKDSPGADRRNLAFARRLVRAKAAAAPG